MGGGGGILSEDRGQRILTGERVFLLVIILRQAPDKGSAWLAPVCLKVQPKEGCLVPGHGVHPSVVAAGADLVAG